MITGVRGVLEATGPDWVEIGLGGITLQLHAPTSIVAQLGPIGSIVQLHTYLAVKEDGVTLYGFTSKEALRLFQLLLSVSGVGPRIALNVISDVSPESLSLAITSGDVELMSKIHGIGKKTAARIILDLRGKLEKEWDVIPIIAGDTDGDVVTALMALGYSASEARQALAASPTEDSLSQDERIRQALQRLGSK